MKKTPVWGVFSAICARHSPASIAPQKIPAKSRRSFEGAMHGILFGLRRITSAPGR